MPSRSFNQSYPKCADSPTVPDYADLDAAVHAANKEVIVNNWTKPLVALLVSVALAPLACDPPVPEPPATQQQVAERPECPHSWDWKQLRGEAVLFVPGDTLLTAPREIQNVPEFHDCQRFITFQDGEPVYDSLFAVFASNRLDDYESDEYRRLFERAAPFAAAEIYAEGDYAPLNIQEGFSCLYVYRDEGEWVATMLWRGGPEPDCSKSMDFSDSAPPNLAVTRLTPLGGSPDLADLYPPVARWGYDRDNTRYYVGIRCGVGWCAVHNRDGFADTIPTVSPPSSLEPMILGGGWYDEQILAYRVNNAVTRPSMKIGQVIPVPELGHMERSNFEADWVPVAHVMMEEAPPGYSSKLGLSASAEGQTNVLSLCSPAGGNCVGGERVFQTCQLAPDVDEMWLMRIQRATGGEPTYYCSPRRNAPEGVEVPATARFRWQAEDETVWVRCIQGCCAVEPLP